MNKILSIFILFLISCTFSYAQRNSQFVDTIRIKYNIPEIAYAVVSSDSVLEINALGYKKINSNLKAELSDRFRLGSITKTITAYLAAVLVKEGKIKWETKFFDLYPELKAKSNSQYYNFTLRDFITFRAHIPTWSYGNKAPTQKEIKGTNPEQRYEFMKWFFAKTSAISEKKDVYGSNPSYVAAGLMLEKATGKTYETLVQELGKSLNIDFEFGQPNLKDKNQPWGHDENMIPEKPALNYKLNWLSSAGNINVSLPDFCKFIQMQLQGLKGKSKLFTEEEFNYMHFGLPKFSFGWYSEPNKNNVQPYSFHNGNPGTFLTKVYICKATNKAFILFANVQSEKADEGLIVILKELETKYGCVPFY